MREATTLETSECTFTRLLSRLARSKQHVRLRTTVCEARRHNQFGISACLWELAENTLEQLLVEIAGQRQKLQIAPAAG